MRPRSQIPRQAATRRVCRDLLSLMFLVGSFGAPLLGPIRETLQRQMRISRLTLGAGAFAVGLAAGTVALIAVAHLQNRVSRARFVRTGALLLLLGVLILAVGGSKAPNGLMLAIGWFVVLLGGSFAGMANALVLDLEPAASRRSAVIMLHATNALGKVFAPLLVLFVGSSLRRSGLVFLALLATVNARMLQWPMSDLGGSAAGPYGDRHREPDAWGPRHWRFWLAAAQFALIAGAEAGVISILGSFISVHRACPLDGCSQARWAAAVLITTQAGIVAGRFVFVKLARSMSEGAILATCLAFGGFAVPAVLLPNAGGYLPALFLLGIAFSATWPAFFAAAAPRVGASLSAFTMAARLFSTVGISAGILFASAVGNSDSRLGLAVVLSTAGLLPLAVMLFATPFGRELRRKA